MRIKSENYISIQGWMRTELNLSGNDLLVYAIIYAFSQDDESYFNGSLQYLADWCGATKQGILKNIKKLTDKNLIDKNDHGYYTNRTVKQSLTVENETVKQSLTTVKQSLTNNIYNKKEIDIDKSISNRASQLIDTVNKKKPNLFDKCKQMINDFTDDANLQFQLYECFKLFSENAREGGTPFYSNTFKGKLNKLKSLSDDVQEQIQIVVQTLDNGWNNFYALKKSNTKNAVSSIEHLDSNYNMKRADKQQLRRAIDNGTATQF